MAEFYDVYQKDKWKEPGYRLMDKFSLKGKKGFVTGGAGGIGRSVAAAWAEAGADVALVDIPASKARLDSRAVAAHIDAVAAGAAGKGNVRTLRRKNRTAVLRCVR